MAQLVSSVTVLPGSKFILDKDWKIARIAPINPGGSSLTVVVTFRGDSLTSYQFTIQGYNWKKLDPSVIYSVSVSKDSTQGLVIVPGIPEQSYDSAFGYSNADLVQPQDKLTPWRLLETIRPAGGTQQKLIVDESVAAAGTGTGTYTPNLGIDYALFTGGISQDTLGTSPHDSYITVKDGNGNMMFKIRGALNSPFKIYVGPLAGTVNIAWANGDSVAHWFLLNIYETVA